MTLRSRLSAAWRAFRQEPKADFPPNWPPQTWVDAAIDRVYQPGVLNLKLKPNTTYHVSAPKSEAEYADELRVASRPSMADECEAMARERDAALARMEKSFQVAVHKATREIDMSPHPLPSAVDESKLTPDYSNLEVPAIIRKRRKKLESVKK